MEENNVNQKNRRRIEEYVKSKKQLAGTYTAELSVCADESEEKLLHDGKALVASLVTRSRDGLASPTVDNQVLIMEHDPEIKGKIAFNELLGRPAYNGQLPWRAEGDVSGDWSDLDDANLMAYIEKTYSIYKRATYNQAFMIVSFKHKINPFLEYIESCEAEWDGELRIESFINNHFEIEGNEEYYGTVLVNYMFAIISRAVFWPGIKYDYVPVLIGKQGIGKSTFFESLAGNEEWFSDSLTDLKGKDAYMQLQGKLIVEMGELTTFKKADQESLKAFITAKSDYYRVPYGHRPENHVRRVVFAGTTNSENFLVDRTGNRRYLPIHLKGVTEKKCGIAPEIVRQLWGEAYYMYKEAGYTDKRPNLKLDDEIEEMAMRMQQEHLEEDSWAASIDGYLVDKEVGCTVSSMELYHSAIGGTGKPSRAESSRIITIMNNELSDWENIGRVRDKKHDNMRVQTWKRMPDQAR